MTELAGRFLPETERTRRHLGAVAVGVGLALFAWWTFAAGPRDLRARIALLAVGTAAAAVGVALVRRPRLFVEVDLGARTWTVVENGRPRPPQPLDSIGPLVVSVREGQFGTRTKNAVPVSTLAYAIHPEGQERFDVAVEKSRHAARLRLKALARAWGVAARMLGGDTCAPADLDRPLHERLRGSAEARTPATFDPAWRLSVEPARRGFTVRSRHRDWTRLRDRVVEHASLIGVLLLVLMGGLTARSQGQTIPGDRFALAALAAGLAAFTAWTLWGGIRDSALPGAVHVTRDGVSYRGARIPLEAIQEIVLWHGVDVVSDAATLTIPPTFYPPGPAADALAHEVRRLVVEAGNAEETK